MALDLKFRDVQHKPIPTLTSLICRPIDNEHRSTDHDRHVTGSTTINDEVDCRVGSQIRTSQLRIRAQNPVRGFHRYPIRIGITATFEDPESTMHQYPDDGRYPDAPRSLVLHSSTDQDSDRRAILSRAITPRYCYRGSVPTIT
ncbi:hypothetical protein LSH36_366g01006 [Paralvinella palmiformis]|uniref:Uncharacterized protein n=1 Tax=Paralvinella palmiformis TaxID=53620 RepID=A0AAD9MZB4_9ANNE|nr:hypothetical protein LSH36_366g01006 [Paralvinella palmiformis]